MGNLQIGAFTGLRPKSSFLDKWEGKAGKFVGKVDPTSKKVAQGARGFLGVPTDPSERTFMGDLVSPVGVDEDLGKKVNRKKRGSLLTQQKAVGSSLT